MDDLFWTLIDSRPVFKGHRFTIHENSYRLPDGHVVDAYYTFEYLPWVNIFALTPTHEVVLVRQFRPGLNRVTLELPGGSMEATEKDPLEAARRELREETGYVSNHWEPLGVISVDPASHTNLTYSFLALDAVPGAEVQLDPEERIKSLLLPLDEVIEKAAEGGFMQALHVSCIFFALQRLGRQR